MVMAPERETIVAGSGESDELAAFERLFAAQDSSVVPARLIGPDGKAVELPQALYAVLLRAVHELAAGNGISILPVEAMLTTQQAADLLNISRPHLIKMLEAAEMPFRMVGTHRRIRLEDVLAYQRRRDERVQAGLASMARAALLDGTYDAMPDDE